MLRLAFALFLLVLPVLAQESAAPGSDLVILVDLSSSMRKNDTLTRAQQLLAGLVDEAVRPGTHVVLIPFGTGVHEPIRHEAPANEGGTAEVRARLRAAIEGLKPRDSYSYLGAAIDTGLETLASLRSRAPQRSRHLVVVSDGPQSVERGDPEPALADVLAKWAKAGLKAPEEWFLWYAYLGEPEADLVRATGGGAGRAVALDRLDDIHWVFTNIEAQDVDLGVKAVGGFTARLPFAVRSRGGAAGRRLRLSVAGQLPGEMKVTMSPREIALVGRETEVDLQLICTGAVAGDYEVALLAEGEGMLHWVEPRNLPLRFRVGKPRITLKDTKVDLGRVAPGTTANGRAVLSLNEDAAKSPPKLTLSVTSAPKGIIVEQVPADAAPGEMAVGFVVRVARAARQGAQECQLRIDAGDAPLSGRDVRVTFEVAAPRIEVAGSVAAQLGDGEETTVELALTPDAGAARLAPAVSAAVKGQLPVGLVVEAPKVAVRGKTTLKVRVRAGKSVAEGAYRAALVLSSPGVQVAPAEVPIDVVVGQPPEPPHLDLPASLDLGDVPATSAAELQGRFTVELPPGNDGTDLVIEYGSGKVVSGVVPLVAGANEVAFRLRPRAVEMGEHVEFVRVLARRGQLAREAGMIALRWRVTEGRVTVHDVRKPEAIAFRGGTTEATLTIEASEDFRGKELATRVSFDALPEGMAVTHEPTPVRLVEGPQVVPVPFTVAGARPGSYRGKVEFVLDAGTVLASAPIPLTVRPLVVKAEVEGDLAGLAVGADRTATIILTMDEAPPEPLELTLQVDRSGLPDELAVLAAETVSVRRVGAQRTPVRLRAAEGAPLGTWRPRVSIKAVEGVVVEPRSFELETTVVAAPVVPPPPPPPSDPRRSIWLGVAVAALALTAFTAIYVGRSKDDMLLQANG
jgi:hypothetical protein